jgi:uncharacterized protein (DUF4213/DUF364 family)
MVIAMNLLCQGVALMELDQHLYTLMASHAARVTVEQVCMGLRYTAVTTSDGGIGLAYTYHQPKRPAAIPSNYIDYEGRPAMTLLEKIKSDEPLERSQALALINALNYGQALRLPEDPNNRILYKTFGLQAGCKVAMVGYFGPLVTYLKKQKAALEIIDLGLGLGDKTQFYKKLNAWADVLVLTATSLLNSTTEEIVGHAHHTVKIVMLGPSTPMVADAFRHLPIQMFAGTVPINKAQVLKAIRHGMGTRVIHRFSKKAYWLTDKSESRASVSSRV